ncbi:MAG: hypothetical protein QMD71_02335 [bacterium]|nr:hypothetical protein [bacterium]
MDTVVRYYTIPPCAFMPGTNSYAYGTTGGLYLASYSLNSEWYAPVNLPDGAKVTEFEVRVMDNNANNINATLLRGNLDNAISLATRSTNILCGAILTAMTGVIGFILYGLLTRLLSRCRRV